MEVRQLESTFLQGETQTSEFKKSTASLQKGFETLCAFLNTDGGDVYFGVNNKGKLIGQQVTDSTRLDISNHISKLEPPATIKANYIPFSKNKTIVKLTATPDINSVPYVYNGKPFWRIESSTKLMPQARYQQLLLERANKMESWDIVKTKHATINDLDHQEIFNTIEESIHRGRMDAGCRTNNPLEALSRLKLLNKGELTNAAVVLFCKDPLPFYPGLLLRVFKFKGEDKVNLLDSKRIYGNAFVLLREMESFLSTHLVVKSEFVDGEMARRDIPEYPPRAIREAIVNAICHRDYRLEGGSISLNIYSDRLEITSHGLLPRGMTVQQLKELHESCPRNERITSVMYRRGIIESAGMGTQEMLRECKSIHAKEPEYFEQGNTFVVRFYSRHFVREAEVNSELTPRLQDILFVMQKLPGECTSAQIHEALDVSLTTRMLRNDLVKLEEKGYIARKGEKRGVRWALKV